MCRNLAMVNGAQRLVNCVLVPAVNITDINTKESEFGNLVY